MRKTSWNVALVTWRVISRNDGSYHMDTPEEEDGWHGIDEGTCIFGKTCFTAMDDIGILKSNHTPAISNHGRRMFMTAAT
ncbi:predicted protein [Lichtheimia corymbifera JMRC:FSU:9682]|uniref:Uncharacterized protein n=1 Tax=Lichtheimia corymbifera JMRC:FSU:9682 TaxID=1263082 RepID=A0A068RN09_9FUNG|nr:predicted protein [Lichtheimia corymbifera JMRC:FSU:9682]